MLLTLAKLVNLLGDPGTYVQEASYLNGKLANSKIKVQCIKGEKNKKFIMNPLPFKRKTNKNTEVPLRYGGDF
ncbi:hypothetical protein DBT_0095 [Dissulfuribacter thermophilus]|uniref:Uncharacterized protein n=1 Tax=Dissulfuribacter thermophilus TaxID=1156395 RepID=A0A1B9F8K9_9BACT|nr:hypothetical protein DBT_0095 [Dissulfuribacter thermophilus]